MKRITVYTVVALACLAGATGCKTTEANYRQAYEKATADNERGVTPFENTIYSRIRNNVREQNYQLEGRDITTHITPVTVTPDGGGIREWLKKYSVVVAEFKQLFNARSMRERLVDAGYPRTFLVQNGEPYYYVVVDSSVNLIDMANVTDSIAASFPLPLKEGFPYILQTP